MLDCREHDNEPVGSIKCLEFRLLEKQLAFQELCSMELDGSYMHRYVKQVCLVTTYKPQIAAGFVHYDGDERCAVLDV